MDPLLAAIDQDPLVEKVVHTTGKIAKKLGATVILCHVMEEDVYKKIEEQQIKERVDPPFSISQAEDQARTLAEEAGKWLRQIDVQFKAIGLVGNPSIEIVSLAIEYDAKMIVMGFEGLHGLGKLRAIGSVSRAVMEKARIPVLIVPALSGEIDI